MADPLPSANTKWCSRGKHWPPLDQFADSYTRDGKQPWCKGCRREYDKGRNLAMKNSQEVEHDANAMRANLV